jgi:hypothetical protein
MDINKDGKIGLVLINGERQDKDFDVLFTVTGFVT